MSNGECQQQENNICMKTKLKSLERLKEDKLPQSECLLEYR